MKWKRTPKKADTHDENKLVHFLLKPTGLVFTTTYARKFHFTKWNREQATRARPAKFVQIVLCAVYAHSTLRTHGDHDECSPSRSSETANLLFIPHSSPLYFLHLSIFLAHAACIRRPRYETLKLNYCCQTPKYNICPTDGYSTIGCDRIPNNINLRYGLHCERSRFHCMKRRVSSPEGNDITECQRSLFASNNRQWEKFARK